MKRVYYFFSDSKSLLISKDNKIKLFELKLLTKIISKVCSSICPSISTTGQERKK